MWQGIREHFPRTQEATQVLRFGGLVVLMLDSNFAGDQRPWFDSKLSDFSKDPSVKLIAVATHHPPFSNSKVVGGHRPSRQAFLDLFQKSPKAKLWLSGHAHGYEHFLIGAKHFIISAGGGGSRQPQAETLEHQDLFQAPYPRPFNYLLISETVRGISITTRGWNRGEASPRTIDTIDIGF
jgi:hypothetical protein